MNDQTKSRITHELAKLASGLISAELVEPIPAVIYHGLPTPLRDVGRTDVLVLVPGGYPATMLDYAFLPATSPLRGVVQGAAQEDQVTANGQVWKRVSYHPHNGGGGPPWDPTRHGFHTYVDELLTWLANGA